MLGQLMAVPSTDDTVEHPIDRGPADTEAAGALGGADAALVERPDL
jgi:hypothetical protein